MKRFLLGAVLALFPVVALAHYGPDLQVTDVSGGSFVDVALSQTDVPLIKTVCPLPIAQDTVVVACIAK